MTIENFSRNRLSEEFQNFQQKKNLRKKNQGKKNLKKKNVKEREKSVKVWGLSGPLV